MECIILVSNKGPIHKVMFSDLKGVEDIIYLEEKITISHLPLKLLNKVHESRKVNRIINLPMKHIWEEKYNLSLEIEKYKNRQIKILFTDVTVTDYRISYLQRLSTQKNISLNLLMINPLKKPDAFAGSISKYIETVSFDKIFTFDSEDAERYGFIYTPCIYSMLSKTEQEISNDLLFVGKDKGRSHMLHEIYKSSVEKGFKNIFYISGFERKSEEIDGIIYNEEIPYEEVIKKVQQSKCLLEIVQEGQAGVTFRTYESICYDKLLLTNNQNVKNFPFYNPKYMQVFDDVNKINWDFLQEDKDVQFGYAGQFSPKHLVELL